MMRSLSNVLFLVLLGYLTACDQADAPAADKASTATGKPRVYAVNYPLYWAASQLAGEFAEVYFPAPPDVDPAFWEPDLDAIAAYQSADLILLNGANYAKWVGRVSLPQNRLLDTSKGIADQYIAVDSGPVHSHGPGGDHSHGDLAFTVWLDLSLYAQQVERIASALAARLPDNAPTIEQRCEELVTGLMDLDAQLMQAGKKLEGAPILYSHPVYQYLQRRYGLNGVALHWEPDAEPAPSDWAQLDAMLPTHPAKLMLWEGEPTRATRKALASRGITSVVFSPQGNRSAGADFASTLQKSIERLAEAGGDPVQ